MGGGPHPHPPAGGHAAVYVRTGRTRTDDWGPAQPSCTSQGHRRAGHLRQRQLSLQGLKWGRGVRGHIESE